MNSSGTTFFIINPAFKGEDVGPGTDYSQKIDWLEEHATKIGLRTRAGSYCFDCKQTLCSDGATAIHKGRGAWFDHCPKCKTPVPPNPANSAGPIRYAKSFFWDLDRDVLKKRVTAKGTVIEDSDSRNYTLDEFLAAVEKCQFQFTHSGDLLAG